MRRRACSWKIFMDSKHEKIDVQDMISNLPETVLHHIKSFLQPSDKDQVRLLSRKWRRLNVQDQKVLILNGIRLDESELLKILNDDFHSLIKLSLRRCSGMKNLKLVNFKLENLELDCGESLDNLHLNTPNLTDLYFRGRHERPCVINFINGKRLRVLHLVGVAMDTTMFKHCNESFPVLQELTLTACDMSGSIDISSNSIKNLYLKLFNNPVGLSIDASRLEFLTYNGSTIVSFQNINFPSLTTAKIELYPSMYETRDMTWFTSLLVMLRCLKHIRKLKVCTNTEKNIIIPQQLRETDVPPLDGMLNIEVYTTSGSIDNANLIDSMLWICPRVNLIHCVSTYWRFELQLWHGELSSGTPDNSCDLCYSHTSRCWRHSLMHFAYDHTSEESKEKMYSYINENVKTIGRICSQPSLQELEPN